MTKHELGVRIRDLRTAAGLSQETCARAAAANPVTWQRWEAGVNQPQATRLGRIAAAIGVPVGALYSDADTRTIADVTVTTAALQRINANGEPELQALTERLTAHLTACLRAAAINHAEQAVPKPRTRRTRKPPRRVSTRRASGLEAA